MERSSAVLRATSLQRIMEESDHKKQKHEEDEGLHKKSTERGGGDAVDESEEVQCMSMILHKREKSTSGEELSSEMHGLWRQNQKTGATKLEKQLKARWELEKLIKEQMDSFYAHYNSTAMMPHSLKDVAQLLMPSWTPRHELATLSWLGDWRPSVILDLVHGLRRSSSSFSYHLSDSSGTERLLSQLVNEIRIEEAIIDEEISEIQATCILHLPFASVNDQQRSAKKMNCIRAEFKKIERVIIKAQQLRYKALELVVKKVLSPMEAAEFLVAFAEIQEAIHQFAAKQKLPKGPLTAPHGKTLGVKSLTGMLNIPGDLESVYKQRR
ncbi:hypothetical protein Tsubulata_013034 [Turnera subulata]|uniref:DOG1 domain-containing protein n=1 Tax=Turnera subulata TaxID=218843 RepID=A0A9Q0GB24_9ROSI|nr:hypothetical protein Tsubulata_013034 [Turnera subulata]